MTTNAVDTYEIATLGQNLSNTFTLGSNGILVDVIIEDLIVEVPLDIKGGPGRDYRNPYKTQLEEVKKITVTVHLNGKDYVETAIVRNKSNLSIKDVGVEVMEESSKPKIKIIIN